MSRDVQRTVELEEVMAKRDGEISTLGKLCALLDGLPAEQRKRAVAFMNDRYGAQVYSAPANGATASAVPTADQGWLGGPPK